MGAKTFARVALLAGLVGGGVCLTVPPGVVEDGIGVAEARTRYRRSSYGSRSKARHARRSRRAPIGAEAEMPALPPERPIELAAGAAMAALVPQTDEPRLAKLRDALQNRANAFVDGPSTDTTPTAPRSVSFDFDLGLKTTVFFNGIVVKEPFDRNAARRLAASPPNTGGIAAETPP